MWPLKRPLNGCMHGALQKNADTPSPCGHAVPAGLKVKNQCYFKLALLVHKALGQRHFNAVAGLVQYIQTGIRHIA